MNPALDSRAANPTTGSLEPPAKSIGDWFIAVSPTLNPNKDIAHGLMEADQPHRGGLEAETSRSFHNWEIDLVFLQDEGRPSSEFRLNCCISRPSPRSPLNLHTLSLLLGFRCQTVVATAVPQTTPNDRP